MPDDAPDLATQLEDLLHAVWAAEADWRLDDRLDLAVRLQARSKGSYGHEAQGQSA